MSSSPPSRWGDRGLAWLFVWIWGSGYLATKTGLHYAAPFTFLALRFALAAACLVPVLIVVRPRWPRAPREWVHLIVAGLLMHAVQLGGSHYGQYWGISAGIVAVLFSVQPLLTAIVASRWLGERLTTHQWAGVAIGLAGVGLVVWHKIDVHAMSPRSLAAVCVGLGGITAGTLYQRVYCRNADLYSGAFIQLAVASLVLAPLAYGIEGAHIHWSWQLAAALAYLVILGSIVAVNTLHTLMRHGQATRVTSLLYLPPLIAVALEYAVFDVVPSGLSLVGVAVTCLGVALVALARPHA
ncbi:MAG: DMT family transporter [Burkholderiales bacterium]